MRGLGMPSRLSVHSHVTIVALSLLLYADVYLKNQLADYIAFSTARHLLGNAMLVCGFIDLSIGQA